MLNPRFLAQPQFDDLGIILFMFWEALCLGPWLAQRRSLKEASSKRLFDGDIADLGNVSQRALDLVCTLASCCMIKRKASDIKHDLEAWWSTAGRDLLASGQAQDPEPDSDDDLPEEPAAQESEEKDPLVESIEATQAGMKLDAELTQLAEDPDFKGLDEKPTEKPDPIEADSDESDQEEAWIKDLDPGAVSTLKDVLDQAKMATFTCQTDDHEGRMLRRVRQLSGPMRNFVAKRCGKGSFPAHVVTTVHAQLLIPVGEDGNTLIGGPLSPIATLTPTNGDVLFEVNPKNFKVSWTQHHVKVELSKAAEEAFMAAVKAGTSFNEKVSAKSDTWYIGEDKSTSRLDDLFMQTFKETLMLRSSAFDEDWRRTDLPWPSSKEEFKDFERFDKALRSAQTSDKEIDETARTETMAMTRWLRSRRSLNLRVACGVRAAFATHGLAPSIERPAKLKVKDDEPSDEELVTEETQMKDVMASVPVTPGPGFGYKAPFTPGVSQPMTPATAVKTQSVILESVPMTPGFTIPTETLATETASTEVLGTVTSEASTVEETAKRRRLSADPTQTHTMSVKSPD
eukprot:g878.t1